MDPWSDPETCLCAHESDRVLSLSESQTKVRARYTCRMYLKREEAGTRGNASGSRKPREFAVEVDAGFERDPSGRWHCLGPKP